MGEGLICRGHNSLPYVKIPSCMVCGKEVDSEERELCLDCEKHSRNFERGFPVFNYVEPVKASVLAIKYHNKKEYCDFYGAQMAEKVRPYVRRYGIDAVTCVPLHGESRDSAATIRRLYWRRLSLMNWGFHSVRICW